VVHDLSREQLHRLARLGARERLEELAAERRAILATFPGLAAQAARQAGTGGARSDEGEAAGAAARKGARRRKAMSAEQRKAVSERMRKFWAEKRRAAGA